jgi:hypothetical protein
MNRRAIGKSWLMRSLSVVVPVVVLAAGAILLGDHVLSASIGGVPDAPKGSARISYELPKTFQPQSGEGLTLTMDNWQATGITGGCHNNNSGS